VASDHVIEAAIAELDRHQTEWVPSENRVQTPTEDNPTAIIDDNRARNAHAAMLRRIAALERALAHATRPGIGHNHPDDNPYDEPLTLEDRRGIIRLIGILKAQPAKPDPVPDEAISAPAPFESKAAKAAKIMS
jgi:hypothetical protein